MGHFLQNHGEQDKTRAGKMLNAVGKAMIYTAQQRSSLRAPLTRLHQVTSSSFGNIYMYVSPKDTLTKLALACQACSLVTS